VLYSGVFSFSGDKGAAANPPQPGHFIKKINKKKKVKRKIYLYKNMFIKVL
jgi:hypothetical protein